jgi:flagellar basal-body rod modification protein FlgD
LTSEDAMTGTAMTSAMGRQQFLQLMLTQLRNQDPLEPIENNELVSQLSQFSTLEGIENLNAGFSDMLALQQLVQGADLVGRKVVLQPAPDAALIEGTVTAMSRQDQQLAIMVDGQRFLLDQVVGVVQS